MSSTGTAVDYEYEDATFAFSTTPSHYHKKQLNNRIHFNVNAPTLSTFAVGLAVLVPVPATVPVPVCAQQIHLHKAETLVPMREACVLARDMLDLCCAMAQPGVRDLSRGWAAGWQG